MQRNRQAVINVSALIDVAVKTYCKVNNKELKEIEVDPADLESYRNKTRKIRKNKSYNRRIIMFL